MTNLEDLIRIQQSERRAVQEMINTKGWEIIEKAVNDAVNRGAYILLDTDDPVVSRTIRSDCRALKTLLKIVNSYGIVKSEISTPLRES